MASIAALASAPFPEASLPQLAARHPRLRLPVRQVPPAVPAPDVQPWSFVALAGRLVEVSAAENSAALTIAAQLLAEAQRAEDLAAWVMTEESGCYPPDLASHGIDLEGLPVVRVPKPAQVPLAAARLTHSGAFGLVVLDLTALPRLPDAHLGRLVQQARRHGTLVLCLTHKPARAPSLGSLVAVRAQVTRERRPASGFKVLVDVLKDKRRGGGWRHEEVVHGAPGLR